MIRLLKISLLILSLISPIETYAGDSATIQLIRSATLKIEYGGLTLLVDPMLSDKGELKSVLGINKNPIVRLPISVEEICSNIDYVICTHTHSDHYDNMAAGLLKGISTICQPQDTNFFKERNIHIVPIDGEIDLSSIKIYRIPGQHGRGKLAGMLGPVSGYILKSSDMPTIYIVGDCILTDGIISAINKYSPDYIVLNSGGAINPALSVQDGAFLMNEKDVIEIIKQSPTKCKFIAVHMEALDHCQTNRSLLKDEAKVEGITEDKLLIPDDGEIIFLSH